MKSDSLKLLFPVYLLSFFSLLILFSTNRQLFWQQSLWVLIGTIIILFFSIFNFRNLLRNRLFIFIIYLISIIAVSIPLFFPPIRGIHAWIPIAGFLFQPVEAVKISLLLIYAYFFAKRHTAIARLSTIIIPFIIFLIPSFIILKQPDTGSVLILFGMWASFLFLSGLRLKHILYGAGFILLSSSILWSSLADYQRERIIGVFSPEQDPLGVNYNVIQSKIAIGSSGWLGKGFGQGTQVQLGFLPESSTDFIIPTFIEEWGLIGGLILILAFIFLCKSIISIGLHKASDNFDRFFCLGAVIVFILHFIINTGSVTGLLPVIGLPFPFVSYGGSNLLTSFTLIAIINSILLRA